MKQSLSVIFLLFFLSSFAQTQEEKNLQIKFQGYVKFLQTLSFTQIDSSAISDNLIHNRLKINAYYKDNLSAELHIRNRLFYGESLNLNPNYANIISQDTGLVDASFLLIDKPSFFLLSQIDRANIKYQKGKWDICFGRQRINWGQNFVWNPNDIFNSYSFFDFDYEEKPGSDAVRFQYYTSNTGRVEIAASLDSAQNLTAAALWLFNKKQFDIQLSTGIYKNKDFISGIGFTGNVLQGSLRGEVSYFHPKDHFSDSSGVFVASFAYDYMLKSGSMLQAEVLYNQLGQRNGRFNINELYNFKLSAKNLSISRWSFFTNFSQALSPLMRIQLSTMYYPSIKSFFTGPGFTLSISQNTELMLMLYHFREFMPRNGYNRYTMFFGRLWWSF